MRLSGGKSTCLAAALIFFLSAADNRALGQRTYAPPAAVQVQPPPPGPKLGVYMEVGQVWVGDHWENGARITGITPGSPASTRLDPGDIILRVNGNRVYSPQEAGNAIAFSGGTVQLRVKDVRTGQIVNLQPFSLYQGPVYAAPAVPPGQVP